MLLSPHPIARTSLLKADVAGDVMRNRNLYCAHYDTCLDEAVVRSWASFTCAKCPLFAPVFSHPERVLDALALRRL